MPPDRRRWVECIVRVASDNQVGSLPVDDVPARLLHVLEVVLAEA